MAESSDAFAELLRRAGQGDAAARAALIDRCQARLRVRVGQMLARFPAVRSRESTSDVLQEVLIDLSATLTKLTPRDLRHFLALAGQHIRWRLLDLARRPPDPAGPINGVGPAPEPLETTFDPARLAQWAEVHRYIGELPAEERELFDLIFYQDVPQTAAAELLGLPPRTLRRRWQAARLRLMERFGDSPFS